MKVRTITRGGIILSLIFISFLIFKGTLNIINALTVPVLIYLASHDTKRKYVFAYYIAAIFFTIIFFQMQTVFIISYCIMAHTIYEMNIRKSSKIKTIIYLSIISTFAFWLSIYFTDIIFSIRIQEILVKAMNDKFYLYVITLIIEGITISFLLTIISDKINKSKIFQSNK